MIIKCMCAIADNSNKIEYGNYRAKPNWNYLTTIYKSIIIIMILHSINKCNLFRRKANWTSYVVASKSDKFRKKSHKMFLPWNVHIALPMKYLYTKQKYDIPHHGVCECE